MRFYFLTRTVYLKCRNLATDNLFLFDRSMNVVLVLGRVYVKRLSRGSNHQPKGTEGTDESFLLFREHREEILYFMWMIDLSNHRAEVSFRLPNTAIKVSGTFRTANFVEQTGIRLSAVHSKVRQGMS